MSKRSLTLLGPIIILTTIIFFVSDVGKVATDVVYIYQQERSDALRFLFFILLFRLGVVAIIGFIYTFLLLKKSKR